MAASKIAAENTLAAVSEKFAAQQSEIDERLEYRLNILQQSMGLDTSQIEDSTTENTILHSSSQEDLSLVPPEVSQSVDTLPQGHLPSSNKEVKDLEDGSEEDEDEVVTTSFIEQQKIRRKVVVKYLNRIPDSEFALEVPKEDALSRASSSLFGTLDSKPPVSSVLPIQKGITDRLGVFANASAKRLALPKKSKYNPDRLLARCYKLPPQQEATWSKPHTIPQEMLTLVDGDKRHFDSKLNTYVLNTSSEIGRREEKLRKELNRAQTCLRVQNSLSLSIRAAQAIVAESSAELLTLSDTLVSKPEVNFPPEVVQIMSTAHQLSNSIFTHLVDLNTTICESQANSNDLFKLQADTYITSATERRDVWLASSEAHQDCQRQLKAMPVTIPHNATPAEFCLLGPDGRKTLRDWSDEDLKRRQVALQHQSLKSLPHLQPGSKDKGFKVPQSQAKWTKKQQPKKKPTTQKQPFHGQGRNERSASSDYKPNYNSNNKKGGRGGRGGNKGFKGRSSR